MRFSGWLTLLFPYKLFSPPVLAAHTRVKNLSPLLLIVHHLGVGRLIETRYDFYFLHLLVLMLALTTSRLADQRSENLAGLALAVLQQSKVPVTTVGHLLLVIAVVPIYMSVYQRVLREEVPHIPDLLSHLILAGDLIQSRSGKYYRLLDVRKIYGGLRLPFVMFWFVGVSCSAFQALSVIASRYVAGQCPGQSRRIARRWQGRYWQSDEQSTEL